MRRGVIWRRLAVFPLARMQSIGVEQGPLDRALSVAGIRAHTISGRVSGRLGIIDRDAALGLFDDAEAAALAAAAADHSHRWAGEDPEAAEPVPAAAPATSAPVAGPAEEPSEASTSSAAASAPERSEPVAAPVEGSREPG